MSVVLDFNARNQVVGIDAALMSSLVLPNFGINSMLARREHHVGTAVHELDDERDAAGLLDRDSPLVVARHRRQRAQDGVHERRLHPPLPRDQGPHQHRDCTAPPAAVPHIVEGCASATTAEPAGFVSGIAETVCCQGISQASSTQGSVACAPKLCCHRTGTGLKVDASAVRRLAMTGASVLSQTLF